MGLMKLTKHSFDKNFKEMNTTMANILIGTLAGFIGGNISSCKLQDLINKKQYINYLILFAMIYILQSWQGDKSMHPIHKLMLTLLAMLYFVMIMRNNYIAIIIGTLLLFVAYEINYYLKYLESNEELKEKISEKEKKTLRKIRDICQLGGLISFGIGFVVNFIIKSRGDNFNVFKHLFGKCD